MFDRFHANVKILRGLRFNFPRAEPNANFNAEVYLPDKSIVSFHASGLGLFARPEQRCCRYFATIMNVSFRFYPCPVRVNFSRDKKDAANIYISFAGARVNGSSDDNRIASTRKLPLFPLVRAFRAKRERN